MESQTPVDVDDAAHNPANDPADDEVIAMLAGHPLTEPLGDDERRTLSSLAEVLVLEPGDVLVHQDDPGEAAYLVVAGRFEALVNGVPVGVVGRGETVGEMALITGEPRSATIVARRSSRVVRIDADDFAGVLASSPETYRRLNALLVDRLRGALDGRPSWVGRSTVVGIVATDDTRAKPFARRLADAVTGQGGRVAVVDADSTDDRGPALYDLETTADVVLIVAGIDDLARRSGTFDRTLLVVDADEAVPDLGPARATDLVLIHPEHVDQPRRTARWLDALAPDQHHHVRAESNRELGRVARRILHRERVLVLGGGGARGLAHLGTYQALIESEVDFDAVVGVSAGAIFGAAMALDWSPEKCLERSESMLIEGGRLVDFTAPMVALASGRQITERLQSGYGRSLDVEDAWRPLTCLSADLVTLSAHYHRRGPLWQAIRSSASVPGVFPPVPLGDAVLVDGGIIDNLPVARARTLYPGALIISSDVGRRSEPLHVDLPTGGFVGGWQTIWDRLAKQKDTPTMIKLLFRLTALGGGATETVTGDVHMEHVNDQIGLFDFAGGRPAIRAGYRLAMDVLADTDRLATPARGTIIDLTGDDVSIEP